jgi:MerR family transcriptional regulator, light-induced transcriptional regulator
MDYNADKVTTTMNSSEHTHTAEKNSVCHHLASRYLELLLRKDSETAIVLLLNAVHDGLSLKDLYLQVLQPAQHELGRLWQSGKINIAEEHFCTAATQQVMSRLYPLLFSTPKNGKVLVAGCSKGELHEIGMRMVTDLFELDGWDTHFFSATTPHSTILKALADNRADLLALSATLTSHVQDTQQLIATVHASTITPPPQIMVGGYPFNADPELWRRIGADGTARGAEEAVREGNRLCPRN